MQDAEIRIAETPQPGRDAVIRERQNGFIAKLKSDPAIGHSTIVTTGRVEEGLACIVRQGRFETVTDLGRGMGGDAAGPSPGFHARVAIAGCIGIAVKMLAAREGMALRSVEVTVETDFDDSALFGFGTRTAAPLETRINIAVDSDEDETRINEMVTHALAMDPWFLALRDPQRVVSRVEITNKTD